LLFSYQKKERKDQENFKIQQAKKNRKETQVIATKRKEEKKMRMRHRLRSAEVSHKF